MVLEEGQLRDVVEGMILVELLLLVVVEDVVIVTEGMALDGAVELVELLELGETSEDIVVVMLEVDTVEGE